MPEVDGIKQVRTSPARVSFGLMLGAFILMGWLHLATPFLAALFSYLALTKFYFLRHRGKWAPVVLFLFAVCALIYGMGYFINQTVHSLPEIADKAIPSIIQWAKQHQMELPVWFTDYDSLREVALEAVKNQVHYLGSFAKFARGATSEFAYVLVGVIVAIGLFLNPRLELNREQHRVRNNLYSLCCDQLAARFATFYRSFAIVMGAQIVISAINTALTTAFVFAVHLPYALIIVGMTFLCGLLPVIGNLISNSIVVGIGFTVSPKMAFIALIFLIVVHKFEYFLNGKIVGDRIHNPLWLTLLALILGEKLMGIPGMILAPVVLSYIKLEAAGIEVKAIDEGQGK